MCHQLMRALLLIKTEVKAKEKKENSVIIESKRKNGVIEMERHFEVTKGLHCMQTMRICAYIS